MTVVAAPSANRLMLLSIRPQHVAAILAGTKTVELRRSRPAISGGQPVAIYSTTPDAAIVALCTIRRVRVEVPSVLWERSGARSGLRRTEFNQYFDGSDIAVGLDLDDVTRLRHPVSLEHLRTGGSFQPPQTWHFLDRSQIERLVGDHPVRDELEAWRVGSPIG